MYLPPPYNVPLGLHFVGRGGFPDPFMDIATLYLPRNKTAILRLCEVIYTLNGIYSQAAERIVSYFITEVDITGVSTEEQDRWKFILNEILGINNVLHRIGRELMCYGNAFISVLPVFKRYLICSNEQCKFRVSVNTLDSFRDTNLVFQDFEYRGTCPNCKTNVSWIIDDVPDYDFSRYHVKIWSPHEIEIRHHELDTDKEFFWRIPEDFRDLIRRGILFHVNRTHKDVLEAIRRNEYFAFKDGYICHLYEPALSGIRLRGWGISRVIANFRYAWLTQVLHRYNEALTIDYLHPMRIITPAQGNAATGGDPITNHSLALFRSQLQNMILRRRFDPAAWFILPWPVNYQILGGDAQRLIPRDLMEMTYDMLLSSIGIPMDMFRGSLQTQSAPVALRLLESWWSNLVFQLNNALKYIVSRLADIFKWRKPTVRLLPTTLVDNLLKQQTRLQLMMSGMVSPTTGLRSAGLEYKDEIRRLLEDQKFLSEQQAKMQQELQQLSQGASWASQVSQPQQPQQQAPMPGGPAPAPTSGMPTGDSGQAMPTGSSPTGSAVSQVTAATNPPTGWQKPQSLDELIQQAYNIAMQLFYLPESIKDSTLINLKKTDPGLHALVRAQMDDIRNQMRTHGASMLLAQIRGM